MTINGSKKLLTWSYEVIQGFDYVEVVKKNDITLMTCNVNISAANRV